jgi:uncharacterized protein YutE (UPF0331/DUF86 family)
MLQVLAEVCIRIGISVLTSEGLRDPENHHDIFTVLGEQEILPHELVESMSPFIELRNLIVHEHDTLEDSMVYGFRKTFEDLKTFPQTIRLHSEKRLRMKVVCSINAKFGGGRHWQYGFSGGFWHLSRKLV